MLEFLQSHHASHPNRQFATPDIYGLQAAFDPKMPAPVPFTLLLAPNGDVVYQELGEADIPKLRRAILANLPDDEQAPRPAGLLVQPGRDEQSQADERSACVDQQSSASHAWLLIARASAGRTRGC